MVQGEVSANKPGRADIRAISLRDGTKRGLSEVTVTGSPSVRAAKPASPAPPRQTATVPAAKATANQGAAIPGSEKCVLTIHTAPPFADVIMDGRPFGTTPIKAKKVSPGKHAFTIDHPNFPPIDTVITLSPGERTLKFKLFQ